VNAVAVSPDGAWLVAGRADGTVAFYEPPSLRLRAVSRLPGAINAVAVSPYSAWVACGGATGSVTLLNPVDPPRVQSEWRYPGVVNAMCASPDGTWVVSGGQDGAVRLWDVPTGQQHGPFLANLAPREPSGDAELAPIESERQSQDGGSADGLVFAISVEQSDPGSLSLSVTSSPVGDYPVEVHRRLDVESLLDVSRQLHRVLPETMTDRVSGIRRFQELGRELFAATLGSALASIYRASVAAAAARGQRLRIVVQLRSRELEEFPWEAMYDDLEQEYVCQGHSLVRRPPGRPDAVPSLRPSASHSRVLGIFSGPGLVGVAQESRDIPQELAHQIELGSAEFVQAPAVNFAQLSEILRDGSWDVIHFAGHGTFSADRGTAELLLSDAEGRVEPIDVERLSDLIVFEQAAPRLVVLSAGESAHGASALIRAGVQAVVALQTQMSDLGAASFVRRLYEALALGQGLEEAVFAARRSVADRWRSDSTDWIAPVVYLSGTDVRLFDPPPSPPEPTRRPSLS
jgi:hypothetical protein